MQQSIPAISTFGSRWPLIGAIVLGALAAILVVAFLASRGDDTKTDSSVGATRGVVVANRDIAVGTALTADMVEVRQVPEANVIKDAATAKEAVVGEVIRYPVAKGEQVTATRIVEAAKVKSLSFQIPAGLRGFTVKLDGDTSPARLIAPGDFVDVIVAGELKGIVPATGQPVSGQAGTELQAAVTLIQNVQVLAVERNRAKDGGVYDSATRGVPSEDKDINNVTLALTPEQSQLLWLAAQGGKVTLALRGFGDEGVKALPVMAEPINIR